MVFLKNKKVIIPVFAGLVFLTVFSLVSACKDPVSSPSGGGGLPDTEDGETRLVISMHDSQLAASMARSVDPRNIQALNLAVRRIDISNPNGGWLTIMEEARTIDIIGASRADPVVLSDVSVEPGIYKELRLVLSDGSTIKVDGQEHPLRVPSGEQSGLKLKGPFEIPKGKLFTLIIDLDTAKSVNHNQGTGWRLQPVLSISNGATVLGIFRGNLTVSSSIGVGETLLQLYSDNTARMKVSSYPNYTLWADYEYNSGRKELRFTNTRLDTPNLKRRVLKEVLKQVPDQIVLPVKQWSLDNIIAIDTSGMTANLYRVDEFDFSPGVTFTEFTLNIDYRDASKIGKDVLTEVRFVDTGMPPLTIFSTFEGSRITELVEVLNSSIQGPSTRILVTSYLFENPEDWNIEMGVFASQLTPLMTGSHFSETTANSWQPSAIFTLLRDVPNQEFTVSFSQRMNIRMDHDNFTNSNPVVNWDPYPNAQGYLVMVIVEERAVNPNKDTFSGSDLWAVAFYDYTSSTSITICSELINFTTVYVGESVIEPQINPGDFIRVEVYALDGSGSLDTKTKTGALAMDSLNIIR